MNIYIDESGSINNKLPDGHDFVIAMVYPHNEQHLKRVYKRFVKTNTDRLRALDKNSHKMFDQEGKFIELKGKMFNKSMKRAFVKYMLERPDFNVFYIRIHNYLLINRFTENTARAFNYVIRKAVEYFIKSGLLPDEECFLQFDERNERTDTKRFLKDYLNTELMTGEICCGPFDVKYFDSQKNHLIQIADVFANLYYSQLLTSAYDNEMKMLKDSGIVKNIFEFPLRY